MAAAGQANTKRGARPDRASQSRSDPVKQTVREIVDLEQRDDIEMGRADHVADAMTAFSGSMLYVGLHAVWFVLWIALNLHIFGLHSFDPYPFGLLTMIVSLEAIFLSTFVLISQNRQALKADRRAKVDVGSPGTELEFAL